MMNAAAIRYAPRDRAGWTGQPGTVAAALDAIASGINVDPATGIAALRVLLSGLVTPARKPADEQRTNDTTLTADTDLKVPMVADATYIVGGIVSVEAASITPDMRFGFDGPTGTELFIWNLAMGGGTLRFCEIAQALATQGANMQLNASTNNQIGFIGPVWTGSTPGDFEFMWKQNTSSGDFVATREDSFMGSLRIQ